MHFKKMVQRRPGVIPHPARGWGNPLRRLLQGKINRIYGFPGDGINGLMGALNRARGEMEFVQARHEELAAFMACAHAKFTGEVGVCMATSGPGAIHLLDGLYDAAMDRQPVVAIVGQQSRLALGADFQQEVDLPGLFKDVARHYVHMCTRPDQARHLIDRAVRISMAERCVTCLVFPEDIQEMDAVDSPERTHGVSYSGVGYTFPVVVPKEEGAAWLSVGAAPPARQVLGIGEGYTGVALVALGYPTAVPPAPPREPAKGRLREIP